MRGIILGYDYDQGRGVISGDDGNRYPVAKEDLGTGIRTLIPGRNVDFLVADGRAVSVFPIKGRFHLDDKNKWVAAALAFFLGIFGAHKFYLGKRKAGVIMLLAFFPGMLLILPMIAVAIISFVEGIIYLVKDDQTFYEEYVVGNRSWF
jgi:TM2 domain-containing membrane protein YozV